MLKTFLLPLSLLSVSSLFAGPALQLTPSAEASAISFKFGLSARQFDSVGIELGKPERAPRPQLFASQSLVGPASNGQYFDGFVRPDTGTDGNTAFFSYGSANERPAANSVIFNGLVSSSLSDTLSPAFFSGDSQDQSESAIVPEMAIDITVNWLNGKRIYIGGGLSAASIESQFSRRGLRDFTRTFQTRTTQTRDTFTAAEGVILPIGPYRGNSSGQGGVLLPLSPSQKETETTTDTRVQDTLIDQSAEIDLSLYVLDVHFGLQQLIGERFYLTAETGLTLNLVDYQFRSQSRFREVGDRIAGRQLRSGETASQSSSGLAMALGAYLEGGAGWSVNNRWSVEVTGRYDLADSISEHVGADSFSFDPSGWSASLGFRYEF